MFLIAVWIDADETQMACSNDEQHWTEGEVTRAVPPVSSAEPQLSPPPEAPAHLLFRRGWPVPSSISFAPEEARACIPLPQFDALLLEKARVISGRFPLAEAEYRNLRGKEPGRDEREIPHFERVFRIAAPLASVHNVQEAPDYDELLILTAWHSVR